MRELPFLHFTVVLEVRRRLACVTGVNIDGPSILDVPRSGDWELDPRVPASEQAGPDLYVDNDLDRGHLVRRRDPGWGDPSTAREATRQTFVYPNAAPQASAFNQSRDLWVGLEDHVLRYAETERLRVSVFTAPVLAAGDAEYRGIRLPRRFWKVAAWVDGTTLRSAGFVLDQTELIRPGFRDAVPPLGAFRTFQVPVRDISALARVDLGVLAASDVLGTAVAIPGEEWRELRRPADIRL